jgi:hypothetical protein
MLVYSETLQVCDKILELFTAERTGGENHSGILHLLGYKKGTREHGLTLPALKKLEDDKLLVKYGHNNDLFHLGGDALTFKESGGYREYVLRENRKSEIKDAIQESGLKTDENVRQTGDSVQNLNRLLKPATKAQIFIAILTLGIAGLAAYISWLNYESDRITNDVELRLKSLEVKEQRIEQQLRQTQQQVEKSVARPSDSTKK